MGAISDVSGVEEMCFKRQKINSFGWYHDTVKIHKSQPTIYTLFLHFDLITISL